MQTNQRSAHKGGRERARRGRGQPSRRMNEAADPPGLVREHLLHPGQDLLRQDQKLPPGRNNARRLYAGNELTNPGLPTGSTQPTEKYQPKGRSNAEQG